MLLRLSSGEAEGSVRRRAALSEFDLDANEDARVVLAELTDSRLLTVSEGTVEVAHEALLREWPRLRGWLEDDVAGRRLHEHLMRSARTWEEGGRDRAELYRGAQPRFRTRLARRAPGRDERARAAVPRCKPGRRAATSSRWRANAHAGCGCWRSCWRCCSSTAVVSALLAVRQTESRGDQRELARLANSPVRRSRTSTAGSISRSCSRSRPTERAPSWRRAARSSQRRSEADAFGLLSATSVPSRPASRSAPTAGPWRRSTGTARSDCGTALPARPRGDALAGTSVAFSPDGETLVLGG